MKTSATCNQTHVIQQLISSWSVADTCCRQLVDKDICNTVYAIKSIHTGYDCFLSMDRESVSTFRNFSSEAGNSSFSVWKLEFLSVETEVYNCGNAKELIAFIRLLFVFCCRWQIHSCFSILLQVSCLWLCFAGKGFLPKEI